MRIDKELKSLIPPLSEAEYLGLEEDIMLRGCREPFIVWKERGILLDGHNRFSICRKYKIAFKTLAMSFKSRADAKLWMLQNQFHRRNLTDFQKIELFEMQMKPLIAAKAKANQGRRTDLLLDPSKKLQPVDTHLEGAKSVGCSKATYTKACQLIREAPPEILDKVRQGEVSIDRGHRVLKLHKLQNEIETLEKRKPVLPDGEFDVIVIDPPWKYEMGTQDLDWHKGGSPYPSLTLDEIRKMEIPAAKDCALFLWTTQAFLRSAFEILELWGFEYKLTLSWVKLPYLGLGNYFRNNVEFVLFGIKGKCPPMSAARRRATTAIMSPTRKHSEKPECFYELLSKLFPGARKLDYFARKWREGWSVYGNEV